MPRRLLGLFHRLGNGLALVEAQRARIGASEHDGLVIAVAPRRYPAYGVDAVLGPVLDDTGGAAGLRPPGLWRYWMMGCPVSASMTMVLT